MNQPWYHPTEIDWQDGLNPLAIPGYRQQRNPYQYRALQDPTMYELRQEPHMRPRMYSAPDESYPQLPGGFTWDSIVTMHAGSWIIGVSGSSDQAQGFLAQVTLPNGSTLFSRPMRSADIAGAHPLYLPTPLGLPDGGSVKLRLINLSAVASWAHFAIWVIEPKQ